MKIRNGFVSNSSSCSFTIKNLTDKPKTLVDFVRENPQLIEQFNTEYFHIGSQEDLLDSAEGENQELSPGRNYCVFGDEQRTLIGEVFDYILRDGGQSESFSWKFEEFHR